IAGLAYLLGCAFDAISGRVVGLPFVFRFTGWHRGVAVVVRYLFGIWGCVNFGFGTAHFNSIPSSVCDLSAAIQIPPRERYSTRAASSGVSAVSSFLSGSS